MGRLSRDMEHGGVFTNSDGKAKAAYISWQNAAREGGEAGWVLYDAETKRVLIPTRYRTLNDLTTSVRFVLGATMEKEMVAVA